MLTVSNNILPSFKNFEDYIFFALDKRNKKKKERRKEQFVNGKEEIVILSFYSCVAVETRTVLYCF